MNVINHIAQRVSFIHFNILFLFGFALIAGIIGSRYFKKLKIPQVVAFIIIGIGLGHSGLNIINDQLISELEPFNYFALGLIGFMIGGELKLEILRKYGKQFLSILLFEGLSAFFIVAILVGFASFFITHNINMSIALGLVLGAIASATAPAATTDVLWEYKSKGPLSTTILGIVALDDALALLLFAFSSVIAVKLTGGSEGESIIKVILHPIYEIGGALAIGVSGAFFLSKAVKKLSEHDKILAFSLGTVLIVLGLSIACKFDMLLASMSMGAVLINILPKKSGDLFELVSDFTPPIYVLFFVLVGAKLHIDNLSPMAMILTFSYILGRTIGKMVGAYTGAKISGAPKSVVKNLPLCLFSQAGVAIGLSIVASHIFDSDFGNTIVVVVTTSTFVVQLIGPICTRLAIQRANETGKNITEEDLLNKISISEVIDKTQPCVYEHDSIKDILNVFSRSDDYYYPVLNISKKVVGIISVEHIKYLIAQEGLEGVVLAHDVMSSVETALTPKNNLREVLDLLNNNSSDYAVVLDKNSFVGIIERRGINKTLSAKMLEINSI